jgi:hypothetical protein
LFLTISRCSSLHFLLTNVAIKKSERDWQFRATIFHGLCREKKYRGFNWWSRSCIQKILVIAISPTPVAFLRFLVLCLNSHQLLWPLSSLLPLIYQLLFCSVFGSFSEALFGAPGRLRVDSGSALGRFRVGSGWFPGGLWVVSGSIPGPLRLVSGFSPAGFRVVCNYVFLKFIQNTFLVVSAVFTFLEKPKQHLSLLF